MSGCVCTTKSCATHFHPRGTEMAITQLRISRGPGGALLAARCDAGALIVDSYDDADPPQVAESVVVEPAGALSCSLRWRGAVVDLLYTRDGDIWHRFSRTAGSTWSQSTLVSDAQLSWWNGQPVYSLHPWRSVAHDLDSHGAVCVLAGSGGRWSIIGCTVAENGAFEYRYQNQIAVEGPWGVSVAGADVHALPSGSVLWAHTESLAGNVCRVALSVCTAFSAVAPPAVAANTYYISDQSGPLLFAPASVTCAPDAPRGIVAVAVPYTETGQYGWLSVVCDLAAGVQANSDTRVLVPAGGAAPAAGSMLRRADGVWEFAYVTAAGGRSILRCADLSSGAGTWE